MHAQTWSGDTICLGDTAMIHVVPTSGQTYAWYDAPTGGNLLGTSDSLWVTPSSSTTYYLQVITGVTEQRYSIGPLNNGIAGGSNYSYYPDGLVFTALSNLEIDTLFVYPSGPGNIVVNLLNSSGTTLQTATVAVNTTTKTAIPVNFCVNAGTGYRLNLVGTTCPSVFRNTGGAAYPYTSPILNITGAINGSTTFYYFFYDWRISTVCGSATVVRHPVDVVVNPIPDPNLGPDRTICDGQSINFVSQVAGTHLWSDGSMANNILVNQGGTYWVESTDNNGCTGSDSVMVSVITPANPALGPDTLVCMGSSIELCVTTAPNTNYLWNNGSVDSCISANMGGFYSVTGTDSFGCSSSDTIFVDSLAGPVAAFSVDTSGCPTFNFTDLTPGQVDDWSWNFGDGGTAVGPSATHTYSSNGIYSVSFVAMNACGLDSSTLLLEVDCLVGVADPSDLKVEVFPNPNSGIFTLRFPAQSGQVKVGIWDAAGKCVRAEWVDGNAGEWRVSETLPAGVYFVRVNLEKGVFRQIISVRP